MQIFLAVFLYFFRGEKFNHLRIVPLTVQVGSHG